MLKMFMKNKKGFTLVELMVVVVIIGILTAIAVPVYRSVEGNAREQAVDATVRTLNGAVSVYMTDMLTKGNTPDTAITTGTDATAAAQALVDGGFLQEVPGNIDGVSFVGDTANPLFSNTP